MAWKLVPERDVGLDCQTNNPTMALLPNQQAQIKYLLCAGSGVCKVGCWTATARTEWTFDASAECLLFG